MERFLWNYFMICFCEIGNWKYEIYSRKLYFFAKKSQGQSQFHRHLSFCDKDESVTHNSEYDLTGVSTKESPVNFCSFFFFEPFLPSCEIWKDIKFTNGGRDGGDLVNVWSLDGWVAASISGHQPPSSAQLTILGSSSWSSLGYFWDGHIRLGWIPS